MDDAGAARSRGAAPHAPIAANTSSTTSPSTTTTAANPPRIQQPKPQALPSRSGPSSILVSPRQKGNPILNSVRSVAWEYSDIPADYVLGATTCALFLSLKYHRLHPEYVYNRIRDLKGQYNLRILLTMVDIESHEEPLRELSKTSLINNVTVMLCWSAQEAGRYLELFKTFEHTAPTSIRAQQSSSYSDNLVEFITVPRSINKTDALGLVSNFGSMRTAMNAGPEEIGLIAGWGEKKVQRWCSAVREPFRIQKAAKRSLNRGGDRGTSSRVEEISGVVPVSNDHVAQTPIADADRRPGHRLAEESSGWAPRQEDEDAFRQAKIRVEQQQADGTVRGGRLTTNYSPEKNKEKEEKGEKEKEKKQGPDEEMSEGIMAALSKLRKQ
ncbi:restriction endonuclease type II-like protein [Dendryphion nanum]|uniref:Restriction endonuclease type II-like protein n=1 Tax=Dendryphion nanum TaxID=256645 RepID=A0A9P9E4W0_9PLEO|nr:restriction endonuclease type II-like protein [Dendryphion nanum]